MWLEVTNFRQCSVAHSPLRAAGKTETKGECLGTLADVRNKDKIPCVLLYVKSQIIKAWDIYH